MKMIRGSVPKETWSMGNLFGVQNDYQLDYNERIEYELINKRMGPTYDRKAWIIDFWNFQNFVVHSKFAKHTVAENKEWAKPLMDFALWKMMVFAKQIKGEKKMEKKTVINDPECLMDYEECDIRNIASYSHSHLLSIKQFVLLTFQNLSHQLLKIKNN